MTAKGFKSRKWGVFCHYLDGIQNGGGPENTRGRTTSWQKCTQDFDCDRFASHLKIWITLYYTNI